MNISRRAFGQSALASLAFVGWARFGSTVAQAQSWRNEVTGYGPLQSDPLGFFDLPEGFSYTVISRAGEAMDDGFLTPDNFDGMGCLPLAGGKLALVRNHELSAGSRKGDATGGDAARATRLGNLPVFGRTANGTVMPGGTTTLVYDPAGRRVESRHLSLAGTSTNCAGGVTPWGSWLSCEETVIAPPEAERSHGWIFEVPATAKGLVDPVPLRDMGRFRHEAAAIDPVTGIAYLTEDRDDGLFYRFLPTLPGKLAAGGRLQALALADGGTDSRNWLAQDFEPGVRRALRWLDLTDVESPDDDLRQRGHAAGAVVFARGEGIHLGLTAQGRAEFYFTCTSGGKGRFGQIFRHVPGVNGDAGTLDLFVESSDPTLMDYGDNLCVAPNGHLIICEDRTDGKINHIRGVTPAGRIYTIARLNADTELAGACFSPDGHILFVNAYAPGRTLAITGPWDRFAVTPVAVG